MATLAQLTDQVNALTIWANAVVANSRNIDELPEMVSIVTAANLPVRGGGVTQKLEIQKIITQALADRLVVVDGKPFRIHKDVANTVNLNTLEINDVIIGYVDANTFLMAVYRGGDQTDFANEVVYEKFSGF